MKTRLLERMCNMNKQAGGNLHFMTASAPFHRQSVAKKAKPNNNCNLETFLKQIVITIPADADIKLLPKAHTVCQCQIEWHTHKMS